MSIMTPNLQLEIQIQSPRWMDIPKSLDNLEEKIKDVIHHSFKQMLPLTDLVIESAEACIVLGDDILIQDLNARYRNKDKPTNVLSFANIDSENFPETAFEPSFFLGDVILSYETILKESTEKNISMLDHTLHLCIHGFLHLLGFDHQNEQQTNEMQDHEKSILEFFNLKNPYQ